MAALCRPFDDSRAGGRAKRPRRAKPEHHGGAISRCHSTVSASLATRSGAELGPREPGPAAATTASRVAIEASVAHLLLSEHDENVPAGALLLQ